MSSGVLFISSQSVNGNRHAPPDRITAYFFGLLAFACFGTAGYLLTRWWMGQ